MLTGILAVLLLTGLFLPARDPVTHSLVIEWRPSAELGGALFLIAMVALASPRFITWSGFNEALFLDASHAAAGGYTGRLVPGALVYCLGEGLVIQTNVINGTGLAFMSMDLSIKQPAYVGDTIHVVVEVTEARAASTGQRGVVTTRNSVRNQHGEDVLIYTPVRLIRGRGYQPPGEAG